MLVCLLPLLVFLAEASLHSDKELILGGDGLDVTSVLVVSLVLKLAVILGLQVSEQEVGDDVALLVIVIIPLVINRLTKI